MIGTLREHHRPAMEPGLTQRLELADRIEPLHEKHGHEARIRHLLADALANATLGEEDRAWRLKTSKRIQKLYEEHGHEGWIRDALVRALLNS